MRCSLPAVSANAEEPGQLGPLEQMRRRRAARQLAELADEVRLVGIAAAGRGRSAGIVVVECGKRTLETNRPREPRGRESDLREEERSR